MSKSVEGPVTIHNIRLENHFTITANETARDPNLSFAAKGLLWYIISQDQGWKIHAWQLAKVYMGNQRGNGLTAIKVLIRELKDNGYIKYVKSRDSRGRWVHRYDVYPVKVKDFQKIFPEAVQPSLVEPTLVNQPIIRSTELRSTELRNTMLSNSSSNAREKPEPKPKESSAAAALKNSSSGGINYTAPGGKEKFISESDIYKHFLRSHFKTETITEAIQVVKAKREPIGNVLKLLEIICFDLEKKPANPVNSESVNKKDQAKSPTPKCTADRQRITPEMMKKYGIKEKT